MNVITRAYTDDICRQILEEIRNNYPYYYPHLYFMYHYGVRIGEVFDFRISIDSTGNYVKIIAQKNNNPRVLPPVDDDTFKNLEKLQLSQNLIHLNKKNLERLIKKVHPVRNLRVGNKNVGAHLFRHNYIKKLVTSGQQFMTIDAMMGYTTQSISDTYAVSKIYY